MITESELRRCMGQATSITRTSMDGTVQVSFPIMHEDGDWIQLYIEDALGGGLCVRDYGNTVMRLSFTHNVDTHIGIVGSIAKASGCEFDGGELRCETDVDDVVAALMRVASVSLRVLAIGWWQPC